MHPKHAWRVAHSSTEGTRHQDNGTGCQDHSCFLLMPKVFPDTLIAAVADGVGTAKHAALASRTAAETAATTASHLLWKHREPPSPHRMETLLNAAVLDARMALEHEAEKLGTPLEELATTLLLLVHCRDTLAAAQIGDGAAVISTAPGEYHTFARPQRGEYVNETTALTSKRALQRCEITIARTHSPLLEIAMLTDGLLNVSLDAASLQPHPPFFASMAGWLRDYPQDSHPGPGLRDTISSEMVTRRTDDDLTLLLAVRNGPE